MTGRDVHATARAGFTANAAGYARGRPDYPAALDDWLRDALGLRPGQVVVDLGAGTGKFIPRLQSTGATPIAIEPVDAMRARLVADHPDVEARAGTAAAIPLDDASADAVVCAQAFHWFATAGALAEIARVLRPGGTLGLVWNVRDESVPWVLRMTGIIQPHEGDVPRYHKGDWRRAFPAPDFGPLEATSFNHVQVGTIDEVIVDRFLSVSFIATLPAATRADVERGLRRVVDDEPTLAGNATIAFPYRTDAFRCIRT